MRVIGKYTVSKFARSGDLRDERVAFNTITTLGREQIMDIWAFNQGSKGTPAGFQEIDLSPTAVAGGTRKCSFFNVGVMTNAASDGTYSDSARNYATYNGWLTNGSTQAQCDAIFTRNNNAPALWNGGWGENNNWHEPWHCMDLCRVDTADEQYTADFTGNVDCVITLQHANLKYDRNSDKRNSLMVQNSAKTITYNYGTDYTFVRATGVVTLLRSGGSIVTGQPVKITYKWHDTSLFADGVCGMRLRCWPTFEESTFHHFTFMGWGKFSRDAGETFEHTSWPWSGRMPGSSYYNYWHEGSDYPQFPQICGAYGGDKWDRYWFTHPFIMNKPTNFAFDANFGHGPIYIQNWNFYKPVWHFITPRVIAVGTGSTPPAVSDAALSNEVGRWSTLYAGRPDNGLGKWSAEIDYDELTGATLREVGLFYGSDHRKSTSAGWTNVRPLTKDLCTNLFSRGLLDPVMTKLADERLEIKYELLLT